MADKKASEPEYQVPGAWTFPRPSPGALYVVLAGLLVLLNARLFYGSLKLQTEHVGLWFSGRSFDEVAQGTRPTLWSAPLDDVFIHFDFARSTARGFPFEWSEGNGYSSGGTSLLYPFVLALGYVLGYRDATFMVWAGIVACVATFATLLAAQRLFKNVRPWTSLLAPPLFLSLGVLNWSLFSGMEVALFLALWGLCFVLWDELTQAIEAGAPWRLRAFCVGLAGLLLVGTRPEAALLLAVFGGFSAVLLLRNTVGRFRVRTGRAFGALVAIGLPGALVMVTHLWANKHFTGDSSAAGALAKLEMHHPYLTSTQVFDAWVYNFKWQIQHVSEYHFSAVRGLGYIAWPLATLPLFFKSTRRYGVLLWLSIALWIATVALNGQVRWQNARYTMPAVAWLMLSMALGLAGAISWAFAEKRPARVRAGLLGPLAVATLVFVVGELPRYREQIWFFGRASRNILEQHMRAGEYLRRAATPPRHRVLVSDAGAIPFVSDMPAFDLIGLGGYEGLPVATASRQGVGAAVELIEHMAPRDRPDVFALYPSWWGTFVLWFGRPVHDFPVRGNVICGGADKVIYDPDWSSLELSGQPFAVDGVEHVVDSLDLADVLSERAHHAQFDRRAVGFVDMKMLPDPRRPDRDLWDASRLFTTDISMTFELSVAKNSATNLLVRAAPARPAVLELVIDGAAPLRLSFAAADNWQELRLPLPRSNRKLQVRMRVVEGELHIHHLFAVTRTGPN